MLTATLTAIASLAMVGCCKHNVAFLTEVVIFWVEITKTIESGEAVAHAVFSIPRSLAKLSKLHLLNTFLEGMFSQIAVDKYSNHA